MSAHGKLRHYVTAAVIEEYNRVFEYEHLKHLDRRRMAHVRRLLKATAVKVKSGGRLKISSHERQPIYECAVAAKADYIVTENTRHFKKPYKLTKIITARRLVDCWRQLNSFSHAPRRRRI